MTSVLIEICTEELPALPILKKLEEIKNNFKNILEQNLLSCDFSFNYTPRRLCIIIENFPRKAKDSIIELFGAPLNIAYNKDGSITPVLKSFLDKNNLKQEDISTAFKNGKEVIYYKSKKQGGNSKDMLEDIIKLWLDSLSFDKQCRWGKEEKSFIRPIRNICVLFDNELLDMSAYSLKSQSSTLLRYIPKDNNAGGSYAGGCYERKQINSIDSYLQALKSANIILSADKRREVILNQIKLIEEKKDIKVEIDKDLLEEIVAITESPTALLGSFNEEFLNLKEEIIVTSMKENQRYFATYKDSKLHNNFIIVSNANTDDFSLIVAGNEKVLKARLSDAKFFYEKDIKMNLEFGRLDSLIFMQGAGSLKDKILREKILASSICQKLQNSSFGSINQEIISQCLDLAKNDLLSEVVGEFPTLQGIMGGAYAEIMKLDSNIVASIKEQYLPNALDSSLPTSKISALVSIIIKLDTLLTLFALDKIPTGSKDPYALRRQARAILEIIDKFGFELDIEFLCNLFTNYESIKINKLDSKLVIKSISSFFKERLQGIFKEVNPSIIRCVSAKCFNIQTSFTNIKALHTYFSTNDIKEFKAVFKRVSNVITKDMNLVASLDTSLFTEYEKELFSLVEKYKNESYKDIYSKLNALLRLKAPLENLFDNVMILDNDIKLQNNRILLIDLVHKEFDKFGDFTLLD